jgi:hypothetical protein
MITFLLWMLARKAPGLFLSISEEVRASREDDLGTLVYSECKICHTGVQREKFEHKVPFEAILIDLITLALDTHY